MFKTARAVVSFTSPPWRPRPNFRPAPPARDGRFPFLHAKIMSAIRAETEPALKPRPTRQFAASAFILTTACVLLLAGIIWMRQPAITGQGPSAPAPALPDLAFNVALPSAAQVNQWTTALDAPLEKETQLVLNDAKNALNSLKNSFLPEAEKDRRSGRISRGEVRCPANRALM